MAPQYCTEAEVRRIVDARVDKLYREVINPMHSSNQAILYKVEGGVTTIKWLGCLIALMIPGAALLTTIYFHYHP